MTFLGNGDDDGNGTSIFGSSIKKKNKATYSPVTGEVIWLDPKEVKPHRLQSMKRISRSAALEEDLTNNEQSEPIKVAYPTRNYKEYSTKDRVCFDGNCRREAAEHLNQAVKAVLYNVTDLDDAFWAQDKAKRSHNSSDRFESLVKLDSVEDMRRVAENYLPSMKKKFDRMFRAFNLSELRQLSDLSISSLQYAEKLPEVFAGFGVSKCPCYRDIACWLYESNQYVLDERTARLRYDYSQNKLSSREFTRKRAQTALQNLAKEIRATKWTRGRK